MKFQEMEEKMRQEKQRKASQQAEKPAEASSTPSLPKNHKPEPKHGSGINAQVYEQSSEKKSTNRWWNWWYFGAGNLRYLRPVGANHHHGTYEHPGHQVLCAETDRCVVHSPATARSGLRDRTHGAGEQRGGGQASESAGDQGGWQKERETTKVSVEKLEVIEIKTDGNTGQLMPIKDSSKWATRG